MTENQSAEAAAYEFTGPDDQGLIRLSMPNLDPGMIGQSYIVTLGCDKDALAEAMCRWLCDNGFGDWE